MRSTRLAGSAGSATIDAWLENAEAGGPGYDPGVSPPPRPDGRGERPPFRVPARRRAETAPRLLLAERGAVQLREARLAEGTIDHDRVPAALRRLEEDVREHLLEDAAQPARAEPLVDGVLHHGTQRIVLEVQVDAVQLQGLAVFLHQRVRWRGQHLVELVRGKLAELHLHGDAPQQLGEHAVLDQLLDAQPAATLPAPLRAEPDLLVDLRLVQVGEGASADEEDVAGIHLDEVVLVPVLGHVERYEDLAA